MMKAREVKTEKEKVTERLLNRMKMIQMEMGTGTSRLALGV